MKAKNWFLAAGLTILVFFMVVLTSSIRNPHAIADLYVFGDSLSDVGNVFRTTGGTYPPNPSYYQGRYSNGRVWVEYLSDRLNLSSPPSNNFAWGGATTGSNGYVPSLLTQVQSFIQSHPKVNSDALYVLWAGANDYLQGASNATIPVQNVSQAIASLADVGAKKILVENLPDLGQLPATRTSGNSASLSALTGTHNQGLRRSLKVLTQKHSDLEIATLDADTLYREARSNPKTFGLSNTIAACFSGSRACGNPDEFLFWDGIHPTTAAHRILGETAFKAMIDAGMVNSGKVLLP